MPVIHSRYRESGTVRIDKNQCITCGRCATICPADVLIREENGITIAEDTPFGCIGCGHCMMVCPEDCIDVTGRGISRDDLIPLPPEETRADADALEALLASRRSIRHFREEAVPPEILDRVAAMASTAPMGIPPWDVGCVLVEGRDRVQEVAEEVIRGYEGFLKIFRPTVLTLMRPFIKKTTYDMFRNFIRPLAESYVRGFREEKRDVLFYDAPALLIFYHSPYADPVDASIACTTAMTGAESLGLGTTIIGGAPPILQRNRALCERLGIPEGHTPCIAMILGWPAVRFRYGIRRHFLDVKRVT